MSASASGPGRLAGKVVLVTGGTAGIGYAVAERAVSEGARVVVTGRDPARGRDAALRLGDEHRFVAQDVADEQGWSGVTEHVLDAYSRLDVLVNNAGSIGAGGPQDVEALTLERWRVILAANLDSVFLGCRAAIGAMREGGGAIVNVSSTAGILGTPAIAAYGAAKAGVRQLTKSVALHCARRGYGIRCNSVHPSVVETDLADDLFHLYGDDPEAARTSYLARVPMGRLGTATDVASAVLYLASDEARYVTGAELLVSGGLGV